jgi:hypothetical protein
MKRGPTGPQDAGLLSRRGYERLPGLRQAEAQARQLRRQPAWLTDRRRRAAMADQARLSRAAPCAVECLYLCWPSRRIRNRLEQARPAA